MVSRRHFIKGLAAAGVLATTYPKNVMANFSNKQIGIQLYTIRDLVKADFLGSMSRLAEIGFNTIETAGCKDNKFYGYFPREFRDVLMDFDIEALSSHSYVTKENIEMTIEDTANAGIKYLVQPYLPAEARQSINDYKKLADEFNEFGELCKKSGLTFAYHNHAFEFDKMNGAIPYNVLLESTDPDLVTMQLDTYWMVYGGYEPVDYFNKFPGRFKLLHVKDMVEGKDRKSTEIGSGIIDFTEIFELKDKSGMECFFLEQEEFEMDEWKSLTQSFEYLESLPQ